MGELGTIIREARRKKGWSLRVTGEAAGVSFVTVRDIERGHVQQPSRSTLEGLALAFDLPFATLALAAYSANGDSPKNRSGVSKTGGGQRGKATAST